MAHNVNVWATYAPKPGNNWKRHGWDVRFEWADSKGKQRTHSEKVNLSDLLDAAAEDAVLMGQLQDLALSIVRRNAGVDE
jgi:hypothetical protein